MAETAEGPPRPAPPTDATADWAARLGYAGLLPFVAGAALQWMVREEVRPHVEHALSVYGAVIVSFLGGIHWGVALGHRAPAAGLLVWGVTPSLLAWWGAMMPPSAGLALLGGALVVCYLVDRRVYPAHGMRAWLTLRFRLTVVASLCCFLGAAGA